MVKKIKKSGLFGKVVLVLSILLMVYLITINGYLFDLNKDLKQELANSKANLEIKKESFKFSAENEQGTLVSILLPAVNRDGKGVSTVLKIRAEKGTGKTLADIDNLLFWVDTQNSIRMAKEVASDITNTDLSNVDLTYSVDAGDAQVISGPSAGAALAIATIAGIEGKSLNKKVMITGSINHDGTIGPVGEIAQKAKAAKEAGAEVFLVPLLQGQEVVYERQEHCQKFGRSQFCTIEQIPKKVNVEDEAGIKIVEVRTIKEALEYFYN